MLPYITTVVGQFWRAAVFSPSALIGKFPSLIWEKTPYPKSNSLVHRSLGGKVRLVRPR